MDTNGTGLPTSVTITGLPSGKDSIQKAFLYWETSYNSHPANPVALSVTNPASTVFTYNVNYIGKSIPTCWGDSGTACYRADVSNSISGNGLYKINLTGKGNSDSEVDGVTLLIIYVDSTAAYSGNMALYDGIISQASSSTDISFTATGFNATIASATASAFAILGDMQSNVTLSGNNLEKFNGDTETFSNNFWDFCNIPTTLKSGQDTCIFNTYTNNGGDCYSLNAVGLYWQYPSCIITGLNESTQENIIKIFPNPTKETLTVDLNKANFQPNQVAVFDIAGRKMIEQEIKGNSQLINLTISSLAAGNYILKLSSNSSQRFIRFSVDK